MRLSGRHPAKCPGVVVLQNGFCQSQITFKVHENEEKCITPQSDNASCGQGLRIFFYFDNIGNMKTKRALAALSGLAQENRLAVFRLLVKQGPEGLTPGVIAESLGMSPPTLSFHLKALVLSGLVTSKSEGRFLRYRADIVAFNSLVAFLTEDCCQGVQVPCLPENI